MRCACTPRTLGAGRELPSRTDSWLAMEDVPDHDALCRREQEFLLRAIREDLDLTEHLDATPCIPLRIVLAAAESAQTGRTIDL